MQDALSRRKDILYASSTWKRRKQLLSKACKFVLWYIHPYTYAQHIVPLSIPPTVTWSATKYTFKPHYAMVASSNNFQLPGHWSLYRRILSWKCHQKVLERPLWSIHAEWRSERPGSKIFSLCQTIWLLLVVEMHIEISRFHGPWLR